MILNDGLNFDQVGIAEAEEAAAGHRHRFHLECLPAHREDQGGCILRPDHAALVVDTSIGGIGADFDIVVSCLVYDRGKFPRSAAKLSRSLFRGRI
ncbi:hypothetical protein D3C71_2017450 [compost metagenome]